MRRRNSGAVETRDDDGPTAAPQPPSASFGQETDNTAKYAQASAAERLFLTRFRARLLTEVRRLAPGRVLDAGCGEGHVTSWLAEGLEIEWVEGDAQQLPFEDGAFDLVLCTEVLEHLLDPAAVLRELGRVSAGHLFITVPHEPFFRMGNLAAGKYVSRLGSTPGHVSTWGRRGFLRAVAAEAEPVRWMSMFPWQGVLARPR